MTIMTNKNNYKKEAKIERKKIKLTIVVVTLQEKRGRREKKAIIKTQA